MNKRDFIHYFRAEILPLIRRTEAGHIDRPLRRQTWNDAIDSLTRSGMLSARAGTWTHPRFIA
jgi:hypothetical protein